MAESLILSIVAFLLGLPILGAIFLIPAIMGFIEEQINERKNRKRDEEIKKWEAEHPEQAQTEQQDKHGDLYKDYLDYIDGPTPYDDY